MRIKQLISGMISRPRDDLPGGNAGRLGQSLENKFKYMDWAVGPVNYACWRDGRA